MSQLQTQINLKPYNTFGIEAYARYWIEIAHETEAREFVIDNAGHPFPLIVWGGGSNILLTQDLEAIVLKNNIRGIEVLHEDEEKVQVRFGAGEIWHDCVNHCIARNWGGIENLSLIPGTIGAAPIQNIGAYGVELKDCFLSLEALHLKTGLIHTFRKEECNFGYRDSIFKSSYKNTFLITRVILELSKQPQLNTAYGAIQQELQEMEGPPSIHKVSQAVIRIRQRKLPDPQKVGNAGSFFKNPQIPRTDFLALQARYPDIVHYPMGEEVKIPAAWLIEQCGWKGRSWGAYGVHPHQALVLVNLGQAKGLDIYHLSEKIKKSVKDEFGIELIREVQVL